MDNRRRLLVAALTLSALALTVVATRALPPVTIRPWFNLPQLPQRTYTPPVFTPQGQPSGMPTGGSLVPSVVARGIWHGLIAVLVVLAAVIVAGLLWRLTRNRGRHEEDQSPETSIPVGQVVQEAVRTARTYLRRHRETGDIAGSIIAAWAAVEEVAGGSGHRRKRAQTATEFTAELLSSVSGADAEIDELLRRYHRARYGTRAVIDGLTEADADRADELLGIIAERIETAAAAEPDARTEPDGSIGPGGSTGPDGRTDPSDPGAAAVGPATWNRWGED